MYISRHMEKVVEECKEQFSVILITGPRQVGKRQCYYKFVKITLI